MKRTRKKHVKLCKMFLGVIFPYRTNLILLKRKVQPLQLQVHRRMLKFDENILKEALTLSPLVGSISKLDSKRLAESWAKRRHVCNGYELDIDLNGAPVKFYFGITKSFPLSLPIIFLAKWDEFGILPHVENDGYICYAREENSLLNAEDITGLTQEAISGAINVIKDGIFGKNKIDFIDKFGAYWDHLDNLDKTKIVISIVSPSTYVKKIKVFRGNDDHLSLADNIQDFQAYQGSVPHVLKSVSAIYIPLKPGSIVMPPHPSHFWSLSDIRKVIFNNLASEQIAALLTFISKYNGVEIILISLPRTSDGETLFGIKFDKVDIAHPLNEEGKSSGVTSLVIIRRDKEYLLPRGGSNLSLRHKRVLLLGCGAVGGFIANELTRAGISRLTLLDKDMMNHENLFRHVLGQKNVNKWKVMGIKDDIEERLPYVTIVPLPSTLENAVSGGTIKVGDYDLIVSALGNPTVELAFNKHIHDINGPPIIFTWLEPYGIGGHALLTGLHNGSGKGCLKCLYEDLGDGVGGYCRAAFAKHGQSFAKNINGCRNLFTPFGSLDAVKTAELATRLAISTLNDSIKTNMIRSWRGDATEFLKNGLELSQRYFASKDSFIEETNYYSDKCTVCR